MVLELYVKLCVTEPDFPGKIFLPPKLGKWVQNAPKQGFFNYWEILSLIFTKFEL